MELEHAVGYSGDVPHTLRYHPSEPNKYLYAAGSCIGARPASAKGCRRNVAPILRPLGPRGSAAAPPGRRDG